MNKPSINKNQDIQEATLEMPPHETVYITGAEACDAIDRLEAELNALPPPVNLSKMSAREKLAAVGHYVVIPEDVEKAISWGGEMEASSAVVRNLERLVAEYNGVPAEDISANEWMEECLSPYILGPIPPHVTGFLYLPQSK